MIEFSISSQFSSIWLIDRTLLGATTLGQNGPGSGGNEGLLHIPQRSSITGGWPSNCLVSYIQVTRSGVLTLCRDAACVFILQPQPTGPIRTIKTKKKKTKNIITFSEWFVKIRLFKNKLIKKRTIQSMDFSTSTDLKRAPLLNEVQME